MAVNYTDYIKSIYRYDHSYTRRNIGIMAPNIGVPALSVDLSKAIIEVPCLGRMWSMKTLSNIYKGNEECDFIKIPLLRLNTYRYIRGCNLNTPAKSASPLLKAFFQCTTHQNVLSRKCGGDTPYLGGDGLIMYENYRPLCLFSILLEKNSSGYQIIKPILRINPEVFSNEDLMAKYVRTKMLSLVYEGFGTVYSPFSEFDVEGNVVNNFEVIISDDINKFIEIPRRPNINDTQEVFNNFLVDNVDNIFS